MVTKITLIFYLYKYLVIDKIKHETNSKLQFYTKIFNYMLKLYLLNLKAQCLSCLSSDNKNQNYYEKFN